MAKFMCRFDCPFSRGLPSNHRSIQSECNVYGKLHPELNRFGFCNFRPGQLDAVLSILHGNDVFVRMATGSGKSLCMFLPPLVHSTKAAAIIISPLVGLMDEQVHVYLLKYILWYTKPIIYTLYCQVCKLHSCSLSAIRVSECSDQIYQNVKDGRYRFGKGKAVVSINSVIMRYILHGIV